ncbi:accessory Sec system translocase SecA2 [Pseudalkalibacillus salsuginis]|uniref:accessory Sec system translocase SecA2 n=1 Tax=Pseudalkalibacillus salsuginis TaxID=2910972 RepID=UPI001F229CA7|nr:accessory Sec system translocase SecA2 [Pseudalkalibacillus salsuginis]MCF6410108.1 accessory Sec system translocase SecA2 [Pseudalkalibacillus salsuginis]
MLTYIKKIVDSDNRALKKYFKIVEHINELEPEIEKLTDTQLKEKTVYFKNSLHNGSTINDIQVEAFAVVREASKRVLGQRHYDVQLVGGLALTYGNISEMVTGEGKTLVASLPSYLRALEGKGVHVITVNEYLAKRDKEIIGQIHEFLGLTVGLNIPQITPAEKIAAYKADITYGVGNEFGFDFLRDNMVYSPQDRVQRSYHFAIIDEVDSVLIDEAKTPLIIAGKTSLSAELFNVASMIVKQFTEDHEFTYDPETKSTNLTDEGINKIEKAFGIDNLYDLEHQTLYHYIIQCLRARVMFRRDVDYIVRDGKIELIDQFTGRIMEGRSLSDGLHQAIEAKEGLEITEENKTQAIVTVQNYFRMYPTLSGMTGTAKTEKKEFQQIYGMDVISIPTNKPKIRVDLEDLVFVTVDQKYKAMAADVKSCHSNGQPVLIGTTSIEQSEKAARYLDEIGIPYEILNAKSLEREVQLISMAGQKGQVTIATNMAGRGTDIILGEEVAELGGLRVIGTERHESRRIDNQLKGRSGRQGDPGSSQFFISIEDDMFHRFSQDEIEKLQPKLKTTSNGKILNKDIHDLVERTQRICEGSNYSIREYNLHLDDIVNEQRNVIIKQLRTQWLLAEKGFTDLIRPVMEHSVIRTIEKHCISDIQEDWDLVRLRSALISLIPIEIPEFENEAIEEVKDIHSIVLPVVEESLDFLERIFVEKPHWGQNFKQITLQYIDQGWVEHLEKMNRLKEGIGLRSYGQDDPMRLYEKEGYEIFLFTYQKIEEKISKQSTIMARSYLKVD